MKVILCLTFVAGLIAVASTLMCNTCDFRFFSVCVTKSSTESNCGNCSTIKASFGSFPLFTKQGCVATCNPVNATKDGIFGYDYKLSCCTTDKCNAGNSIKVSFSLGLGMALLWLLNAV